MDDGKDSDTFVIFDKEMTTLTKQEVVVLAFEELLYISRNTFKVGLILLQLLSWRLKLLATTDTNRWRGGASKLSCRAFLGRSSCFKSV